MKKLLILGANPETVSLIERAKEMGVYTIVTDYTRGSYAKKYADKSYDIDASDVDSLEEIAKKEKVDGVLVGVAEALLPTYLELCDRLQVPCFTNVHLIDVLTNKRNFKRVCREYGIPTVMDVSSLLNPSYPLIVKPTDSSGSKGISICYSESELLSGIEKAKRASQEKEYILEEYIEGEEIVVYYVVQDGAPIFVSCCDRYVYREAGTKVQLPTAYIFQSKYTKLFIDRYDRLLKNMMIKIGMKNGSIFFQGIVRDGREIIFYEAGHRLNGAQEHIITSKLIGIDAKEIYINYALFGGSGNVSISEPNLNAINKIACKLSPIARVGRIHKIYGLDDIGNLEDVIEVRPSYQNGDMISGDGTLKQIVCRIYIISDNKRKLQRTLALIFEMLRVVDEFGNDMIIGRFLGENL